MDFDRFFSRLNPAIVGLLRSPLHGIASKGLLVLEITGRRSGKQYAIPVGYQWRSNDVWVLVSKSQRKQWWRNFRTPHSLSLVIRRERRDGSGVLIDKGSADYRQFIERTFRQLPGLARQFDIDYQKGATITEPMWERVSANAEIVRIQLQEPGQDE